MDSSESTLNQFFSIQEKTLSKIKSSKSMEALKKRVEKEVTAIKWSAAFQEVIKQIEDLLNIRVVDIMTMAWNKYRALLKYTDKEKYSPNDTFLVPLAEHTIKSEHKPYLEILINDKSVGKIDFSINIALTLKGFILKIQDAKIKEIQTGTCKGKGTIKCEDVVIMEKETESFPLPGSIILGEGIPITV
jgi:hypothetical protein